MKRPSLRLAQILPIHGLLEKAFRFKWQRTIA